MAHFVVGISILLPYLIPGANPVSPTMVIPTQSNTCHTNCICKGPTITCTNTIPDIVTNDTDNVVLEHLSGETLTPRRFCDVTWPNVRSLFLAFGYYPNSRLNKNVFDCLEQIHTLMIRKLWSWMIDTAAPFYSFTNVTTLQLSRNGLTIEHFYTRLFSERSTFSKLKHLTISLSKWEQNVDQDFIDALSNRPIELLDFSKENKLIFDFRNASVLCQTLQTIILHDSHLIVRQLPGSCDSLQYVDLSGNQDVTQPLKHCIGDQGHLETYNFLVSSVKTMRLDRVMRDDVGYRTSNCAVKISYKLENLYFSHNTIPDFEILFDALFLKYINLSHNHIKTINPRAFVDLPALLIIDLSFNNLNEMPDLRDSFQELFHKNENLTFLDLSSNGLSYLPDESFSSSENLVSISLSHNSFTQLSFNISNLHKLELIDLRYNEIQYLDAKSRQKVDFLNGNDPGGLPIGQGNTKLQILLEGNPFTCRCEALPFLQWFVISTIFNSSYTCTLDDKNIPMTEQAVHEAFEDCERPMRRRRTIALSTILTAVTLTTVVAMVTIMKRRHKRRLEQQRFNDRLQLIREEDTGFQYTVFLSYSGLDRDFVVHYIRQPMEQHLRTITHVHKEHVADDSTLIPGHPIMPEIEKLIAKSAVFVAVVSAYFCQSFYCNAELKEANDRRKPIILIFKEHVEEATMDMVLKAIYVNNVCAKILPEGDGYIMVPDWERLSKAIIGLVDKKN